MLMARTHPRKKTANNAKRIGGCPQSNSTGINSIRSSSRSPLLAQGHPLHSWPNHLLNESASARNRKHTRTEMAPSQRDMHGRLEQKKTKSEPNRKVPITEANNIITDSENSGGTGIMSCISGQENSDLASSPFVVRDASTLVQRPPSCKGCQTRSGIDTILRDPGGNGRGSICLSLFRDPFSAAARKRLTVDTAQYIAWASSSSIIHDVR